MQIMDCHIIFEKPSIETMLAHYQMVPWEQIFIKQNEFEMTSVKSRPFSIGRDVLTHCDRVTHICV